MSGLTGAPGGRYITRLVDPLIAELLAEFPAIQLLGPRAGGKTTTALRFATTVVRLDRPEEASSFAADPDAALRGLAEPVLLDEWQQVPDVLGAVKRSVDTDPRPGRFVITGSVRAVLDAATWPGTGRVINVRMVPLVERELNGRAGDQPFFDKVLDGRLPSVRVLGPDLREYVEMAVRGGFPEVVASTSPSLATRWLDGYGDHVAMRDSATVEGGRDPERLSRYLRAVAANTAGIVEDKRLYDAAGITRPTAVGYEQLLRNLFLLDAVPAWSTNLLQRLVSQPKRYLVDPGLAAALLHVGVDDVMRDGDLLGRILDTFVTAQLRAEAEVSTLLPRLYHLREQAGRHEVDLLADCGARGVIAMEIKATAAPKRSMAQHLEWLRDRLGHKFARGILFHTGTAVLEWSDRITALPIAAIWT